MKNLQVVCSGLITLIGYVVCWLAFLGMLDVIDFKVCVSNHGRCEMKIMREGESK